jgi:hypothetical protein
VKKTAASSFTHFARRRHRKPATKKVPELVKDVIPQSLAAAFSSERSTVDAYKNEIKKKFSNQIVVNKHEKWSPHFQTLP